MYSTTCPCGVTVQAEQEGDFVAAVTAHVTDVHPEEADGLTRDGILSMATIS